MYDANSEMKTWHMPTTHLQAWHTRFRRASRRLFNTNVVIIRYISQSVASWFKETQELPRWPDHCGPRWRLTITYICSDRIICIRCCCSVAAECLWTPWKCEDRSWSWTGRCALSWFMMMKEKWLQQM